MADDANDFHPGCGRGNQTEAQALAQWTFVAKDKASQLCVDQADTRRISGIVFVEVSTLHEGNSHRGEVAWGRGAAVSADPAAIQLAFEIHRAGEPSLAEGQQINEADIDNPCNRAHACD